MSKRTITILGDRQSGRSRAGALVAMADAIAGRVVLVTSHSYGEAEIALHDTYDLLMSMIPNSVRSMRRINGQLRIELHAGGIIHFSTEIPRALRHVDTHILDDVMLEAHDQAENVVRVVLR